MKLTTVRVDEELRAGRVDGDNVVILPFPDVGALIASGEDWQERAARYSGEVIALDGASFAPVVPHPEKIFCVGLNYADHADEASLEVLGYPTLFAKFPRALIGPFDDLVLPESSNAIDWEIELAVVLGKRVRHASESEALEAVAGYAVVNDVSMRDWQLRTSQYLAGKTFEATTPFGPYLVTPDEANYGRSLNMTLTVNGEPMQRANTDNLVFSVQELISYISTIITLVPGDVILTGTPSGVGHVRTPPIYLTEGSVVEATIDHLGTQTTLCVKAGKS